MKILTDKQMAKVSGGFIPLLAAAAYAVFAYAMVKLSESDA